MEVAKRQGVQLKMAVETKTMHFYKANLIRTAAARPTTTSTRSEQTKIIAPAQQVQIISPPPTLDSIIICSNKTTAVRWDLNKIRISCKDGSKVSKKSPSPRLNITIETPPQLMAVEIVPFVRVPDGAEILSEENPNMWTQSRHSWPLQIVREVMIPPPPWDLKVQGKQSLRGVFRGRLWPNGEKLRILVWDELNWALLVSWVGEPTLTRGPLRMWDCLEMVKFAMKWLV